MQEAVVGVLYIIYDLWWHVLSSDHIIKSISLVEVNQAIFAWSFCENPMPENPSGTMYLPV